MLLRVKSARYYKPLVTSLTTYSNIRRGAVRMDKPEKKGEGYVKVVLDRIVGFGGNSHVHLYLKFNRTFDAMSDAILASIYR